MYSVRWRFEKDLLMANTRQLKISPTLTALGALKLSTSPLSWDVVAVLVPFAELTARDAPVPVRLETEPWWLFKDTCELLRLTLNSFLTPPDALARFTASTAQSRLGSAAQPRRNRQWYPIW